MISKSLVKSILAVASKENKDLVIVETLIHIFLNYDYNDLKAGHVLEMLVDPKVIVSAENINLDYIKKNLNLISNNSDNFNIKNIKVGGVDNINGTVKIEYDYCLAKTNKGKNVPYINTYDNISFLEHPEILIK